VTLPLVGETRHDERQIHKALLYYLLWCVGEWGVDSCRWWRCSFITCHSHTNASHTHSSTTVFLFFFKMQSTFEHAVVLLAIDQFMVGMWLLGVVLAPGR